MRASSEVVEQMLDNLDGTPKSKSPSRKESAKFWSAIAISPTKVQAVPLANPASSELLRRKRELIGKTVKGHLKVKGPAAARIYWLRWNSTKCDLVTVPFSAVSAFFNGGMPRNNARVQCVIKGINPANENGHAHPYCTAIAVAKRTRTRKKRGTTSSMPPSLTASPSCTPAGTPEPRYVPMVASRFARPRRITIGETGHKKAGLIRSQSLRTEPVVSKPAGRVQRRATAVDLRKPGCGVLKTRPVPMVFSEMLQRRKSGGFWNNFMFGNHQTGKQAPRDSSQDSPASGASSESINLLLL